MFLNDFSQRKLSSLLRPWLIEEPELQVKLGFLRSHAVAKNLRFDTSVFNHLIGDTLLVSFKHVTIEELDIRIAPWSAPAFTVQVRGVNVTLCAEERVRGRASRVVEESIDGSLECKKNILAKIDPQGSALHESLEKVIVNASSRNSLKTSIVNAILRHIWLYMHDIRLRVDLPVSDDPFAFLWDVMEINVACKTLHGCFLGSIVGSFIRPLRESPFDIDVKRLEIRTERKEHAVCIFSSTEPYIAIRLKDHHLVDLMLCVPEMKISLSPDEVAMILALGCLVPVEPKQHRNGVQLWKLARSKIGNFLSPSGYMLYKTFNIAVLCLRLAKAYEHFLLLVGYPADETLQKTIIEISEAANFSIPFKQQLGVISEIEKHLPAEAIAWARRVGRHGAKLKTHCGEDSIISCSNSHFKFLQAIFLLLVAFWRTICKIFKIVVTSLSWKELSPEVVKGQVGIISEGSTAHFRLSLNVGKLSVLIYPLNAVSNLVAKRSNSNSRISYSDLLSFCLFFEGFLFIYEGGILEQNLSFSLGCLKVTSAPVLVDSENANSLRRDSSSFKEQKKGSMDDLDTIVCGDSAPIFSRSGISETGSLHFSGSTAIPFMDKFLGEMRPMWKRLYSRFQESETLYTGNPCLLCEFKVLKVCHGLDSPDFGFWKCNLTVGQLNFAFGYTSVLSIACLIMQMQRAICLPDSSPHGLVLSKSSGAFQELPDMSWHRRFKASAKKMRMAMFNLFPDRHIELGAVIAGPLVQLSLRNNESSGSTLEMNSAALLGFNLTFIFNNICLAVWPTLDSGHPRYLDIDVEFFTLVEPKRTDISESTIETHVSKRKVSLGLYLSIDGLDAYFEDSEGNRRIQILELKPVTIKLSALRVAKHKILVSPPPSLVSFMVPALLCSLKDDPSCADEEVQPCHYRAYLHSFGTTEAAFSAALHCVMQELSVSFCTDELYVIFQVVGSILSAAPTYAFGNFGLDPGRGCQASAKHGMLRMKPKTEIIVDYTEGGTLNLSSDLFIITSSFKLDSVHVILHNSRKSNGKESSLIHFAADSCKKMGLSELPGNGVWLSVQRTCLEISCEGQKAEVHTDFSVSQAVIFRHKNQIGELTDHLEVVNVVPKFFDCLSEASFSGCTFTLVLDCPMDNSSSGVSFVADTGRSSDNAESLMVNSTSASKNGRVTEFTEEWSSESNTLALGLGHWLLMSISLNMIFVGSCLVKNFLFHAHQPNRLQLLLSVSEECQRIVFGLQDGFLFVETAVLVAFARYWTFYLHFMRNLVHVSSSLEQDTEVAEPGDSMSILGNHHVKESGEWKLNSDCQVNHKMLEALTVNLSQLFLVFLAVDESGRVQEIIWKVDFCLNLGLQDGKRKFLLNLHQLKILSQVLDEKLEHTANEVQAPHFSFASSSSLKLVQEDLQEVQNMERAHPQFNNASCSSSADSARKSGVKGPVYEVFQASDQHYILKELAVSVSAEKHVQGYRNDHSHLRQGWAGKGSGSGFDMIISLPEIQMLMAMLESLSEVFGKEASNGLQSRIQPSVNQETVNISVAAVHDGAIVAICDVHQHLYITVECLAGKYSLAGGIHYSLVGERALFKIEYQKKRRWHFADSWFSLVSLYAKSDTGEPMRLTYCSGSGFVHISSTKHGASVLWKIVSCKAESYEGDTNMEPFNMLSKSTFYLVNKNSDCGIAFINGVPEFVRKPGSPFKFKIFGDSYLACDIGTSETDPVEADGSNLKHLDVQGCCSEAEVIPCINLRIDKANFTIVHELSGQKEVSPLLKGCISNIEVLVQVLCCKTRVISTFTAAVNYFDSHRMQWRELIRPLETCVFYRSRLHCQEAQTIHDGVPISCHLRMEELDILVTEISLDILLYVVGKLDLAGPFAVKSSSILANCCKVENQLDLNILCQFYDAQTGRVGRKQSVSFFLRHIMDQALESLYVSIKLDNLGTLSTTPIYLPLSETRAFAWRMRIMSLQDQRTYPGPFVVFDISKNNEEGVSIAVTPLLRVHNATVFPMELRFQRPQQTAAESASVLLKPGDIIDDCMAAFDAVNLSGSLKKALMSLSVGNFLLSFRPEIEGDMNSRIKSCSVEWSDNLKGGKAVHLSGLMDKLAYKVRNAFSAESRKYSFSTTCCSVRSGDKHVGNMHFLVQSIGRKIPILKPNDDSESKNSFVAMQEQKEVFLLPTVRVTNLLQSDIHVLFSETDICPPEFFYSIGNQATVPSGSAAELYANPAIIFFTVNLVAFNSSCKPVNGADLMKKLNKQKDDSVQFLDIDLEFCGGKYFACLRLTRGDRGILEAVIFTSYTLRNDTDLPLLCSVQNQKPLSRDEAERSGSTISPNLGSYLPPRSMISWFMKSKKLCLKLLDEGASQALLDLDALSGLAEISLNIDGGSGFKHLVKLGVSLGPLTSKMVVPSRIVSVVPRYVVSNESDAEIYIRQCFVEDDLESIVGINSKQKRTLVLQDGHNMKKDITVFDKFLRKHRIVSDDSSTFVQFRTNDTGLGWSGPVCVASLGRFFLKFKRSLGSPVDISNSVSRAYCTSWEFAVVHVVEETSSFVLRFQRPPDIVLPYRIENHLNNASITFYQKDTFEPESLAAESSVDFVWDDLTRPHKLVVRINGFHLLREINLDKLRPWKPFSKARQQSELAYNLPMDAGIGGGRRSNFGQSNDLDIAKVGYEVCADGPTRVLRICFSYTSHRAEAISESCTKIRLRVSSFSVHLLEHMKQDLSNTTDASFLSIYAPIIVGRLENISLNSIFIDQQKYYQIRIQSINIDQKWVGAPFAAMLRRHQLPDSATEDNTLFIAFVLNSTSSNVRQVKYSSLLLQPIDLNLDEETLMKIVPFWRTSLSKSTRSQQYYFDHFEIHPVKIMACFLPAESYSSYSSAQETLRSLLHSVIKIPVIKNVVVELNGVLVTHALITARELMVKCAQHYSWYVMRAIYIAKGSPLLPPTFASVFDDLASSSLDVFFDPSSSLLNVQGLTLGTFKLIKKCIERKGFSGTKRYFGDLGKTLKTAGSNILFTAVTEISDSVLKGAESSGFSGMVIGFHQGILKLAMEPSLLGTAFMEGGPDRKIKLDRSPGVDELYIEGYLQAMLDTTYKQEYLRVRVIDNQVILKNLPPNSALIDEIMDRVKDFLVSKALLKGDSSTTSHPLRHLRGEHEWRIGPTVLTLCEHLFVSFAIRMLRKQASNVAAKFKLKEKLFGNHESDTSKSSGSSREEPKRKLVWQWGIGKFVMSALVAYIDGRLCRGIPNPVARRIVSGFLLSFLDRNDAK